MKEYKCKNCETIFTGISDSLQCPECEEEFTHTELQVNSEKCNCKEMTCLENCTKKHTCHAYWCEKCEPEKYTSSTTSSSKKKIESIKKELEWLRRRLKGHSFDAKSVNLEYVDARIDDIINVFLKNSRE